MAKSLFLTPLHPDFNRLHHSRLIFIGQIFLCSIRIRERSAG